MAMAIRNANTITVAALAAAGFTGAPASAADLPLKAKAAEQVRICGLYGPGYYFIPGTGTCIRLGGYVRYEAYGNAAGGTYPTTTPQGAMTRAASTFAQQARFRLTGDVRTQTEYGTLRSYFAFGVNWLNNPNGNFEPGPGNANTQAALERAFVQFAGFTLGRTDTFFAFYDSPAYNFLTFSFDGSTGTTGMNVLAYSHSFADGLTATIALEDQAAHAAPVIALGSASAVTATAGVMGAGLFAQPAPPFNGMKGMWVPDIVGNLRLDRDWGAAQIKGALHRVGAAYYSSGRACAVPNTTACGHPADAWGWAVGGGLTLKMPWNSNDTVSGVVAYAQGASRYAAFAQANNALQDNGGLALGPFTDAVFAQDDLILTRAFSATVAFEHYWTARLRTSVVFGYLDIGYSDAAKAQLARLGPRCALGGAATTAFNVRNCDPDWSAWRLASRTLWTPVDNLDVGLEVGYSRIETAFEGAGDIPAAAGNPTGTGLAPGIYAIRDQGVWSATFRVQRSFWP